MATITAIGTAVPPLTASQTYAETFLRKHYADKLSKRGLSALHSALAHSSIRQRHIAFAGRADFERIVHEDQDRKIARYTEWAVRLASEAARAALRQRSLRPDDVGAMIVNTCTGYICPGISTYLVQELDLPSNTRLHDLVGAGCAGAIPNLQVATSIVDHDRDKAVLAVSVEICSATFQMSDDLALIISNAIFGDGAGAAVLESGGWGFEVLDSVCHTDPRHREAVRYEYRNGQLHNKLSKQLPEIVGAAATPLLTAFLARHGLDPAGIRHWAIHPAGHNVIENLKTKIGLSEEQLAVTRGVLADYGNMSSAGVWFELKQIMEGNPQPGEWCVMLTFGAGFSLFIQLLRVQRQSATV